MLSFAFDTHTLSDFMRGQGRVAERLSAASPTRVGLPAVVVYEINFGLRRAGRREQLTAFARMVQATSVLNFDTQAADQAARVRVELDAQGTPIGPHELLIAATALRYRCTLITHSTREFSRVAGLALEDWY